MNIGASYSTVSAQALLSELLPLYEVDRPDSCRFWQRGVNDTYLVCSAESKYSLRVYRHQLRSRSEIDFEVAALNYLDEQGVPVARPINRRDGAFISEIEAPEGPRYVIVTTHADGSELDYDDSSNGRLFGEALAHLHDRSNGFETRHTRPRLELAHLLDAPLNTIRPFLEGKADHLAFIDRTASDLRQAIHRADDQQLDIGFCHGDCHGCNAHCLNGVLTHFDFDCCGFGYRVFELATFKWGIRGDDNEDDLWSMFLEGYQSRRDITDADRSLIDVFVVIRHLWWMALIMGNARDFGHRATSDEFIDHQIKKIKTLQT